MEIKSIYIIPLVLIAIILAGGVYYWQKNNQSEPVEKSAPTSSSNNNVAGGAAILGDSSEQSSETSSIDDGQTYLAKIAEIRKPINDSFTDLSDKMKYPNLFPQDVIINLSHEIDNKIDDGIQKIEQLDISSRYKEVNSQEIESLKTLQDSLVSLRKSYDPTNSDAQVDREAFAYKIDQSNSLLKNIQIPN